MSSYRLVSLEENDTATLVASGQVVARLVKLDCGYDVGCRGGKRKSAVSVLVWEGRWSYLL